MTERTGIVLFDESGNPIIRARSESRTPGPLTDGESGVVSGDTVVKKGTPVWRGTGTRWLKRDIKLKPPVDTAEIGTAHNAYDSNG